jgi:hypothetical protein
VGVSPAPEKIETYGVVRRSPLLLRGSFLGACPEEFCPRGSGEGRNVNVARDGNVKVNVSVQVYGLAFHLAGSSCF